MDRVDIQAVLKISLAYSVADIELICNEARYISSYYIIKLTLKVAEKEAESISLQIFTEAVDRFNRYQINKYNSE